MHILVVEDESKVASLIRRALEEEEHSVQVALNGEEGLDLALTTQSDLIILDWLLPGRDGLTICRVIRESGSRTPILMLTARDAVEHRVAGLDSGADDYLTKPFALGELLARVRALFRRGVLSPAPVLTIGDLVLDPASRSVRRGELEIDLSAREFSLLDHLMRNAGRTLTRSMIAERVWGYEFDSGTNVVDVYINYLRNKIDRGHAQKLIHTMRGVGYRLSVGDE